MRTPYTLMRTLESAYSNQKILNFENKLNEIYEGGESFDDSILTREIYPSGKVMLEGGEEALS